LVLSPAFELCQAPRRLGAAKLRKMRVLLADDHPGLLAVAQSLLKRDVDVVRCVDNGESLVDAAVQLRPDVIVTDISMPRLSGLETVDRLRESGCSSKVVFLTAHSDPDFIDAALKVGGLAYVLKTSIVTDLLFAIQEALAGRVFVSFHGMSA
jgi:DNA-binding NarL/FixJ family response regulator